MAQFKRDICLQDFEIRRANFFYMFLYLKYFDGVYVSIAFPFNV